MSGVKGWRVEGGYGERKTAKSRRGQEQKLGKVGDAPSDNLRRAKVNHDDTFKRRKIGPNCVKEVNRL